MQVFTVNVIEGRLIGGLSPSYPAVFAQFCLRLHRWMVVSKMPPVFEKSRISFPPAAVGRGREGNTRPPERGFIGEDKGFGRAYLVLNICSTREILPWAARFVKGK